MAGRVTSEQRRRDLITVALRQYVARGIEGTTRTSLATELGVDRVIVHRLYPDLDDLFDDVLTRVRQVGIEAIDEAAAAADDLEDLEDVWPLLLGMVLRAARSHPDEWQFLFLTPTGAGTAERLTAFQRELADRVVGELTARAPSDGSAQQRQEVTWGATFLYQGLFGSIAAHLADGDPDDDDRFVAYLADLIDEVLAPDEQGEPA